VGTYTTTHIQSYPETISTYVTIHVSILLPKSDTALPLKSYGSKMLMALMHILTSTNARPKKKKRNLQMFCNNVLDFHFPTLNLTVFHILESLVVKGIGLSQNKLVLHSNHQV